MSKHTPGPWSVREKSPHIVSAGTYTVHDITENRFVCQCFHGHSKEAITKDEMHANARLIAAAPDLLFACRIALDWLNQVAEHAPIVFGGEDEIAEQLEAAIAKAVGEPL